MANKPFEIQSSSLRLGGVELEAGTTGVVIPGVTQATSYQVEEVNESDNQINPNDPPIDFNDPPLIIDSVTYSDYLSNGSSTDRATYSCEIDDNEIDEVNVNTPGIYVGSEVGSNASSNLFAYNGTESDPFVAFTAGDWIRIPFRPKMRAREVENIGGDGAGNKLVNGTNEVVLDENGNLTLPGDITTGIDGQGGRFIQDGADGITSMRWINVSQGGDNTQIMRVYTGDPKLETEVERAQLKLNWDVTEDKSGLTVRAFDDGTMHDWQFKGDGHLEFPDGSVQVTAYTGQSGPSTDFGSITLPEELGSNYKGLQVSYGVVHSNTSNNELNVNKIVIHKPAVTTTEIDASSDNDYFRVAGLSSSDVLAMFVFYGDVNGPKPLSTLQAFAEAAIDTVILNNAVAGNYNDVDQMKAAFYDNYPTLVAVAGGLDQDFEFYQTSTNTTTGTTTVQQGSGAIFTFADGGGGYSFLSIANGGSNYLPGHKLVVLGSTLGGTDGINDAVFTVNNVDAGAITSVNLAGTSFATAPAEGWTFPGTNYQVGSGFGVALVGKNTDNTLYANYNAQGSGYVVGDILTLPGSELQSGISPDNDITITITEVDGAGAPTSWTPTGTFPEVWPTNNISDGGNDQYDTANYINSSVATEINYNNGNTIEDGTTEFGTGSSYSFVYNTGIFGLFVSGNQSTFIGTSGGSGADGNSITEAGNIYGPNTPERTFDNAISHINIVGNPYAGPIVSFVKTNDGSEVDILIEDDGNGAGIGITRSNNQGIFNPYREGGWDSDVSPVGIGWNIDGWADLSDVESRTYTNLYAAFGFGGLGNKIVGTECIMYLPDNGKYYAVKFGSWTQNANGGGFSYTRRELDLNNLLVGIGFSDGTRLTSAYGVGRVKSTAVDNRRIEEVTGFKQVSVTSRTTSNDISATVYGSAAQNLNWYVEIVWDAALGVYLQGTTPYTLTVSTDGGNTWYPAYVGGYSTNISQQIVVTDGQSVLQASADSTIAYRIITGAAPVVWWDKNDLPAGGQDFRGAVIDYHAWTGESTIIGTIHIVDDDGEEHISHQEVQSGTTDGENDDLWLVQNEGQIHYRRIDGEGKTLKIHWTAKVFYGSELYD